MDHGLRGTRIGAHTVFGSFEGELEPRIECIFRCDQKHTTSVMFSREAELPATWTCRICGNEAVRIAKDKPVDVDDSGHTTPRTHWDMLLERRSRDELEELLQERLTYLRQRRAAALANMRDSA